MVPLYFFKRLIRKDLLCYPWKLPKSRDHFSLPFPTGLALVLRSLSGT